MPSPNRPTVREIAKLSGFSKSLVALALKNDHRVAEPARLKIQALAAEMGYEANPVVAHLMAQLRVSRLPAFKSNLALINCSKNPDIYRWHTFADFRQGAFDAAIRLGYRIDDFWLHEPDMSLKRLTQIFQARQIPGLIFVAALDTEVIHDSYEALWKDFPCAAIGIVKTTPQIACSCCDHFQACKDAVGELAVRGYRRPGLVISRELNELLERRISAGYHAATEHLEQSIPAHFCDLQDTAGFERWLKRYTPDTIVTMHHEVLGWLHDLRIEVPEQIGVAHLDWFPGLKEWAGMRQDNRQAGASAVDLVVHQLHTDATGASAADTRIMVTSRWVEGKTALDKSKPTMAGPVF